MNGFSFDLTTLTAGYVEGRISPEDVVGEALRRARAQAGDAVWITVRNEADVMVEARALAERGSAGLPLFGIPFAVKDNIDVAGLPTTAACPEFAYTPSVSAPVVEALRAAGAILIGKTNLDQFATGLVGVRSPYGACRNPFDPSYVAGGSSAGSAVAVATGAVGFALGTDTAGSGRVPAAFCNVVGWKGTCGRVSTRGVVPACRSLDCVTVFALTAADAARVAHVAAQFDPEDPFARRAPGALAAMPGPLPQPLRLGVPNAADLAFFGNAETPALFDQAVRNLATIGAEVRTVDLHPFLEAARLLYEGPWVAERTAAVGAFLAAHPAAGDPVVRRIIEGGGRFTAVDAFTAAYRLRALKRRTEAVWSDVDVIVTPTAGTIPTLAAVTAEPVQRNSDLGYYTNFMNLLDLAAVAIPAGFQRNGLPFGVTLFAPAFRDDLLLSVGWALQQHTGLSLGATGQPLPASGPLPLEIRPPARTAGSDGIELAVFGAHMAGLPLNPQLTDRGARLVSPVATAARYRLYALQHLDPPRPGLVCDPGGGASIAGELWAVPADQLGSFLAGIEPPLAIGKVELSDGRWVTGFLCESHAIAAASDISRFGGWRAWRAAIEAAV